MNRPREQPACCPDPGAGCHAAKRSVPHTHGSPYLCTFPAPLAYLSAVLLAWLPLLPLAAGADAPLTILQQAQAMPDRLARPGAAVALWGNINAAWPTDPTGMAFEWIIDHPTSVSYTVQNGSLSGPLSTPGNVRLDVVFQLTGVTRADVLATLYVRQGATEQQTTTTVTLIGETDASSSDPLDALEIDREIAAEKALYSLYRQRNTDGSWDRTDGAHQIGDALASTALAVWAYANHGYTVEASGSIYQPIVVGGLEFLFEHSSYTAIGVTPAGNPDMDGNGLGVLLGEEPGTPSATYAGYVRGICLAAVCAAGSAVRTTVNGPFENGGAGTAYIDIVQDAADAVAWCLGNNTKGGWGYRTDQNTYADLSIASWNYVGLEAAEEFGATLPDWSRSACEPLLTENYKANGSFQYDPYSMVWMGTTCAGLIGLTVVTDQGRGSGIPEAGKMLVQNVSCIGTNWAPSSPGAPDLMGRPHGNAYEMWTAVRGLRMAKLTHLIGTNGPFDWQRHITAPNAPDEGFWPYLVRTQNADGDWPFTQYDPLFYTLPMETAWQTLCLSKGVVGMPPAVRAVDVVCTVPKHDGGNAIPTAFHGLTPTVTETTEAWELRWTIDRLTPSETVDLTFEQDVSRLVGGESRVLEEHLGVSYDVHGASRVNMVAGPLALDVESLDYEISAAVGSPTYRLGERAVFVITVDLPPGQHYLGIDEPGEGRHVLEAPDPDAIAVWTSFVATLVNGGASVGVESPLVLRGRTAPSRPSLTNAVFGQSVSGLAGGLDCEPGRVLELDVAIVPNAAGVAPALQGIDVFYNTQPVTISLEVTDERGMGVAALPTVALRDADHGQRVDRSREWLLQRTQPGEHRLTASLCLGGVAVTRTEVSFAVEDADESGGLVSRLDLSRRVATAREPVVMDSLVRSTYRYTVLEGVTLRVCVTDESGNVQPGGEFETQIGDVSPGRSVPASFTWDTGLAIPGDYRVVQTVQAAGGPPIETTREFEVVPSLSLNEGIAGQLLVEPDVVEISEAFDLSWSLRNAGNARVTGLSVQATVLRTDEVMDGTPAPLGDRETVPSLDPAADVSGQWAFQGSKSLGLGEFYVLLQTIAGSSRADPQTAAVTTVRIVDTVAPTTTVTGAPASEWTNGDVTLTLAAEDVGSGVDQTSWTLNGVTTVGGTIQLTGEGTHTVTFRSMDNAGNVETDQSLIVGIDKTAPTIGHDAPDAAAWQSDPVTVTATGADSASGLAALVYALDGGADSAITEPITVTGAGTHELLLRATDAAGNTSSTTTTLRIDASPPTTTVTGAPASEWTNGDVTLALAAEDAGSGVDQTSWTLNGVTTVGSSIQLTGEGTHTVTFRSMDNAGNMEPDQNLTVRIDTTAPTIGHDAPDAAAWQSDPVTITATAADTASGLATLVYALDGGAESAITEPITVTGAGTHELLLRATDTAGNTSTTTTTLRIDASPPTTTVTGAPASEWTNGDVTLTLAAEDVGSGVDQTSWTLNGVTTVGSSIQLTDEGTHTITFRSMDNAGNVEPDQGLTVRIDTTAPTIGHDAPDAATWQSDPVTVTATGADSASGLAALVYALDGGAESAITEPITVTGAGTHELLLRATDTAGNTSTTTMTLRIDASPPTTAATGAPASEWTNGDVTLTLAAEDVGSGVDQTSWTLNGATTVGGTIQLTGEGTHTITFRSTDNAGNVEPDQSLTVRIDKTAPTVTHDYAHVDEWTTVPATVRIGANDSGSGVSARWYRIGDGVRTAGSGLTLSTPGEYLVTVGATDVAGNERSTAITLKLRAGGGSGGIYYTTSPPSTTTDREDPSQVWSSDDAGESDDPVTFSGRADSQPSVPPSVRRDAIPTPTARPTLTNVASPPKTVARRSATPPRRRDRQTGSTSRRVSSPRERTAVSPSTSTNGRDVPSPNVPIATASGVSRPPEGRFDGTQGSPNQPDRHVDSNAARAAEPAVTLSRAEPDSSGATTSLRQVVQRVLKVARKVSLPSFAGALFLLVFIAMTRPSRILLIDPDGVATVLENPDRGALVWQLTDALREGRTFRCMVIEAPLIAEGLLLRNDPTYRLILKTDGAEITLADTHVDSRTGEPSVGSVAITKTLAGALEDGGEVTVVSCPVSDDPERLASDFSASLPTCRVAVTSGPGIAALPFIGRPFRRTVTLEPSTVSHPTAS
ncbi:MAG: hypothetical protein HN742_34390 [Lentisphaerae bacterium]|nr:hypothetical protein [Lentisphaerota bacterium]MBT7058670.1 hypothetical protein [Lentisphaerota bacterium]MBT7847011.1 hypothetical protein [Lentisphaerota bacterium]